MSSWQLRCYLLLLLAQCVPTISANDGCGRANCVSQPTWAQININGNDAGLALVVEVAGRSGLWVESYFVEKNRFLSRYITLVRQVDGEFFVSLDAMVGVHYRQLEPGSIDIFIPTGDLSAQLLVPESTAAVPAFQRGKGVLLGYNVYTNQGLKSVSDSDTSAYLNMLVFRPSGSLRSTSLVRHDSKTAVIRLDSAWQKEWLSQGVLITIGDHVSAADAFGQRPRRAGISIRRAFEFEPLELRYPTPVLSGESAVPATVDLYIESERRARYTVDAGQFTIYQPPVYTGPGTAQLVVTNILGEEVLYQQDFFVTPQLLKAGLSDFNLSLGAVRQHYGQRSNDYGSFEATLQWRYGWSPQLTTNGSAFAAEDAGNLEIGFAAVPDSRYPLLVDFGVGAYRLPNAESGELLRLGSSWQAKRWFADLRHTQAFSGTRKYEGPSQLPFRKRQFVRSGIRHGRAALSLNHLRRDIPGNDRFWQSSINGSYRFRARFSSQINVELFQARYSADDAVDLGLRVNWIWSPRLREQAHIYADDQEEAGWQYQWMRQGDIGYQWRVQGRHSYESEPMLSADMDHRNTLMNVRARASSSRSGSRFAAGLSGSLGFIGSRFFAGREPGNSFALVDLNGLSGVTIFRDNQRVAESDDEGLVLIPGLRPYQDNRIHLNPQSVPLNWHLPLTELTVRPGSNTGVFVDFQVTPQRRGSMQLYLHPGKPVPDGAEIRFEDGSIAGYSTAEGRAYVSGLVPGENTLLLDWGDGKCQFALSWKDSLESDFGFDFGNVPCR